jgi:hypothetical protein
MLNSGKKIRALRDKKNILTLVLSEKKILNEMKKKPWSNMKILMLFHDFDVISLLFHDFDVIGSVIP